MRLSPAPAVYSARPAASDSWHVHSASSTWIDGTPGIRTASSRRRPRAGPDMTVEPSRRTTRRVDVAGAASTSPGPQRARRVDSSPCRSPRSPAGRPGRPSTAAASKALRARSCRAARAAAPFASGPRLRCPPSTSRVSAASSIGFACCRDRCRCPVGRRVGGGERARGAARRHRFPRIPRRQQREALARAGVA